MVEDLSFERIVVTRNPASTNARQSARVVERLQALFPGRFEHFETKREERANVASVAEVLRDGDIVVPMGGDSTASQAARAIALRQDLDKVPLLPLPFGHANQLALTLNSGLQYRRPMGILRRGKTVPIHPLCLQSLDDPLEPGRLAFFALGIGLTGRAAFLFDTPSFRSHPLSTVPVLRKLPEIAIVARAVRETRPFRCDGRQRIEVLIANGPRVAKHGRFEVSLPERAFALFELTGKRLATLMPVFTRLLVQYHQRADIRDDPRLTLTIEALDDGPIPAQSDGHPFVLRPGTFAITRAARPIYAVTTRHSLYAESGSAA